MEPLFLDVTDTIRPQVADGMKFHLDMPSCGTASRSFRGNTVLYDTGSSGAGAGPAEFFGGGLRVTGGGSRIASVSARICTARCFAHNDIPTLSITWDE